MKLLLIHQAFAGPHDPGGTRHYEFGRHLAQEGDKMVVVTSAVSYLTGKRSAGRFTLVRRERDAGVTIDRIWTPAIHHRGFGWRVAAFAWFALASTLAGLRVRDVDLVMGTSPPMPQAVSAWIVARLRRKPFLLEIRDLWPEFAIGMGILRRPALQWSARWLERFLYAHADHIVVNSPAYRDYLLGRSVPESKITLIPNGVDITMFDPASRGEAIRARYGLQEKVVALYAGAHGPANDLDTILDAAALLRDHASIHFLFVGDGKERPRLMDLARRRQLTNVTFAGALPKSEMPQVLAAADICIATLRNIPEFTTTYPNKVFDYMAAGRPTVLAIDGVIREVIESADGGVFVPPGDSEAMAEALALLENDEESRRQSGANARLHVERHFDRSSQVCAFRHLMRQELSRCSSG